MKNLKSRLKERGEQLVVLFLILGNGIGLVYIVFDIDILKIVGSWIF